MPNQFDPNNSQHVVSVSGRKFITFVGLQARMADQGKGLIGTEVEVLQNGDDHESGRWVIKVGLTLKHWQSGEIASIQAIGDASEKNVGKMIQPHMPRMAETRALVRALRLATRSDYTAVEEIGEGA